MTTRHRFLAFLTIAVGAAAASASAGEQTGVQASSAESSPPPTGTGVPAFAQAQWVAPPADRETGKPLPLFRKEFRVAAQPRRAMLRIVGLGDYDPRVNGVRLAHTGINQPWSQYEKTTYYRDFDIAALVRAGDNCVGVMLANSFWNNPHPPQGRYNKDGPQRTAKEPLLLCAEITLEHTDGTVARLGTDATWRTGDGPIDFSHIFAGEDFDARRQRAGWDRPGFDDVSWQAVRVAAAPKAALVPRQWPPFEAFESFAPASIAEPAPGVFVYSFPQNCSAQLRVELEGGKPGDRISFRCGEHKNAQERLFGGYVVGCDLISDGQPEDGWIAWQSRGADQHSLVADPLFVNSAEDDYRLKPESPAFQLGFEPIPVEKIGVYQSPLRASWPIEDTAAQGGKPPTRKDKSS